MINPHFDFKVSFREDNGRIYMTVSPVRKAVDYTPKEVEITKDQHDTLRFHFGTAEDQKKNIKHLTYFD